MISAFIFSMIKSLCEANDLHFIEVNPVHGGDINQAFKLETSEGILFLKINDADKYPKMFEKEADGLQALAKATSLRVPAVV